MGVYLSQPETNKHVQEGSNSKLSYCSAEMQGWRRNMEDAVITKIDLGDGNALFAVFDGHGGFEVSKLVSMKFPKILQSEPSYKKEQYKIALDQAFKKMDQFIQSSAGHGQLKNIRKNEKGQEDDDNTISGSTGCTANVVLITPKKIIVANAGDSRSALCRNGQTISLSFDHKPEDQEQSRRIIKAGGNIVMGRVNGGLNLTRSFGDFDYKRNKELPYSQQMITCKPDIKQFNRQKKDQFILIGCDGIWQRYVEDSKPLIDKVREDLKNKKQKEVVINMLDFLLAKDNKDGIGCDNMSAILIRFLQN